MDDLIYKQSAINVTWFDPVYKDPLNVLTEVRDRIRSLPSVQPELRQSCDKVAISCNDLISRQAAIDVMHGYFDGMLETDSWSTCDLYNLIENIPSVHPDPDLIHLQREQSYMQGWEDRQRAERTGKWEGESGWEPCSECGWVNTSHLVFHYCPNCGARMTEVKDETD